MTASTDAPDLNRYAADALERWATALLQAAGLPADKAEAVAGILVEGDLLGHWTHGLQLLPAYLDEITAGRMTAEGEPERLSARGVVQAWDGRRLPGPWLTLKAIAEASVHARQSGTGIVNIRHSHHIAALAPYARRVADDGLLLLLLTSSPGACTVAPFGGTQGVFSPSPIGAGWPSSSGPVMVDVSTSITTNGLTGQLAKEGKRLPHPWLLDEQGRPSDDPAVLQAPRQGTILPLGGTDSGHKGYSLGLTVEALTAGLAGQGRADPGPRWGGTVYVQVTDPAAFNGLAAFHEQMDWIGDACRRNPPVPGGAPVRLPGEAGLKRRAQQLAQGVALRPSVVQALQPWAERLQLPVPVPRAPA